MRPKAVDSRNFFDPRVLSELRGLELRARRVMEGLVAGLHKSPFQGFSVEFAEHRQYAPGDDIRHIDWRVFGRTDRHYVRTYEQETNFDCYVVVDSSESMQFKGADESLSKLEYSQLLAVALGWLVIRQRDSAGLAVFDRSVSELVAPSNAAAHVYRLLEVLGSARTDRVSEIGSSLHELTRRLARRSVIVVLSDFFEDHDSLRPGLRHLRHAGHDVSLLQIVDRVEQDFPFDQPTLFRGMESLADHAVDPRSLAQAYRDEFAEHQHGLQFTCRRLGIDHTLVRTNELIDEGVRRCLRSRRQTQGARR